MAKGRRVSGIFVPIQLDTSAVQRDMEALGSDLSTTINKVSKSLDGALNPKAILKGVVDLNKALGEMRDSAKIWEQMGNSQSKFSTELLKLRPQLKNLAQEFGGTIKQQRELMDTLIRNKTVEQEVKSLKSWESQLGRTREEIVKMYQERGHSISQAALKEFIPDKAAERISQLRLEYQELARTAGLTKQAIKMGEVDFIKAKDIDEGVSAFMRLYAGAGKTREELIKLAESSKFASDIIARLPVEKVQAAKTRVEELAEEYYKLAKAAGVSNQATEAGKANYIESKKIQEAIDSFKRLTEVQKLSREELIKLAESSKFANQIIASIPVEKVKQFKEIVSSTAAEYRRLTAQAGVTPTQQGFDQFKDFKNIEASIKAIKELSNVTEITTGHYDQLAKAAKVSSERVKEFFSSSTNAKKQVSELEKLTREYERLAALSGSVASKEGLKKYVDTANIKQAVSAFQQLNGAQKISAENFEQIAKGAKVSTDAVKQYVNEMQRAANSARGWTGIFTPTSVAAGAQSAMAAMGVVGGMYGVVELGKAMFDASLKMDSLSVAFKSVYNNAETADAQLQFVASTSNALGLSFTASAEGAKKLFAAAQGTEVQDNVNELFKSFSMMGTALKLTGDEMNSVFLAISQMISKGKVSAEELRLQLAERMPGAVQLFAKSMGIMTKDLDKLLQDGKVGLSDLVKFSETVGKTYIFGALEASRSLQSEMNRVQNEWFNLKKAFVDSKAAASTMQWLAETLKSVVEYAPAIKTTAIVVGQLGAVFATFKILDAVVPMLKGFMAAIAVNPVGALALGLSAVVVALGNLDGRLHRGIPLVEDYGLAFSELQKHADAAATAVGNTATVIYERQKAAYEKMAKDMKEGLSGGFAGMFESLKNEISGLANVSFSLEGLVKAKDIADQGRKAAEDFSNEFYAALQKGDESGQQKAVAKYEATARAILENVKKYSALLPDSFIEAVDKMLGSVSNLYMSMEDKGARLRDGAFAAAIKELGLNLPKFTAEFDKLQKAAANTPFGKLEKKDLVSEDAVKSIAAMATALGDAQQKFNDFNAAAEKNGTTSEALAAAQDTLNGYYDIFKTALNNAGAAALANGTSLDTFKEGVINMLNQAGLAAPILEHLTGIVRNFGAEVRAAAEAANIKKAEDLLIRFKTMGLKPGSANYEDEKKKQDLAAINKLKKEGAITDEEAIEYEKQMNAGYERLANTLKDRVGKSLEHAQNKLENYADSLKALSTEVQNLEIAYSDQNSTAKEAMLLAEKNTAIAKAQAKADQDIRKKNATVAEATAYVELSTKKAELEYALKLRETEEKTSEARLSFYKDLSAFSGEYEQTAVYQNKLLETQARLWRNLGIPMADINKMIEYQRKEMSKDFSDGATRGLEKYIAKAKDFAAQAESMVTSFVQGFEDATTKMFTDFIENGKFTLSSFKSIFASMLSDLVRISLVRPITIQLASAFIGGEGSGASAGQSGGGSGGAGSNAYGMAQRYATGKIMDGATSAFGDTINGWAASAFPSTFAPNAAAAAYNAPLTGGEALLYEGVAGHAPTALGPTSTFTGSMGTMFNPYTIGGSIVGSTAASYLSPAIWGNSQEVGTGTTVGSAAGVGIGTAIILANGWNPFGWAGAGVMALSTLLGGVGGGGVGSIFGGGGSEPGLWVDSTTLLSGDVAGSQMEEWAKPNKGRSGFADTNGQGYYIEARARNGAPQSAARSAVDYLGQLSQQVIKLSASVKDQLSAVDSSLGSQYYDLIRANPGVRVIGNGEGDDTPDVNALGKQLVNQAYSKITNAVAHSDLSKIAIAADGMTADTMAEMSKAIAKAAGIANISASMGDYVDEYLAAISKPLLDALNAIDTSKLQLTVDKSSLAGWAAAAVAIQAMDNVKMSIDGIITPASEMTVAMTAANTQLDTWIASLKQLGWQESAIAEVEAKRSAYLEQYWNAMARGAEQNLYLRSVALSSGTDSLEYQMQALKYQQENERNDYAKKYGSEDELLAAKAAMLNKEQYWDKTDWDNVSVYDVIKAAGMTVTEWLERYGRDEGFTQDISLSNQLMYTHQAEATQAELNYWQKQYDSMMKAQIAAEQEKASADFATFRDKISDEQNKLQEQYRAEQELMQAQISSTRDAIGSLEDLVDSFENASEKLDDARHNLWGGTNNLSTSRMSDVRANWSEVYAKAMAGDTEAMSELPNISTNLLNLGKEQIESRDVYQDLFYDVDRKLKDAQDTAKSQYSVNKSQYDAQKSLLASQEAALDAQKAQYDAQNAKLTAQLSAQQAAYNTQVAQLNAQSAQLNAQNTSNYTLSDISSKISSLTAQLAKSTTQAANTPTTQNEALLQSKANQLNMIGYMGRTNWNSQSVQNAIHAGGMSLDQWWTNYGFGEGISSTYKSTTSTKYNSDAALLAAKAAKMNEGETLYPGQTAGGWTAAKVAQSITSGGLTISEWYNKYGKAEGFATGGITPANEPFWVGEHGKELVVSPRQYGVLSNSDSMRLVGGNQTSENNSSSSSSMLTALMQEMILILRQSLTRGTNTDKFIEKMYNIFDKWDVDGAPAVRA